MAMAGGAARDPAGATSCPYGRASIVFPLSISGPAALGLVAAVEGQEACEAWDADVVGYTTPLTTEAGACSVRLAVRAEEALGVEPGNYAAALQAEGSSGWLPGLANTCHGVDGGALGLEVVVLARPDARMSSLMYLPEESLRGLLPRRPAAARVRLLRPLLMKQLADCPGQWLRDRLLKLADTLEGRFGAFPAQPGALDAALAAAGLSFCAAAEGGPVGPADSGQRVSKDELGYWTEEMQYGERCAGSMDGQARQALQILEGEAVFLQQAARDRRLRAVERHVARA